MKIRKDFVTNSSSSSYIIAINKELADPDCFFDCWLDNIVEDQDYDVIENKQKLISSIRNDDIWVYECEKNDTIENIYDLDDSYEFRVFELSYHNFKAIDKLDDLEKKGKLIIIYKEES